MSAAATPAPLASVTGGILNVAGTSGPDSISVILDATGRNVSVSVGNASQSVPLAGLTGIFVDAGGGNDTVSLMRADGTRGIPIPATVAGGNGNDRITGGNNNDSLAGGAGNDSLFGGPGNDFLNGGTDAITGSPDGADFMSGGPGVDTAVYSQRTDNLSIDISNGRTANDGAPGEGDSVQTDVENVFGGAGNDSIVGNAAPNLISGGGGNDTIKGGAGNDRLIGGRGNDTVLGQAGTNLYSVADYERDDIDVSLDSNGLPIDAFVSYDPSLDVFLGRTP
jgi:Ca2+-binding RTX toxin-like protein